MKVCLVPLTDACISNASKWWGDPEFHKYLRTHRVDMSSMREYAGSKERSCYGVMELDTWLHVGNITLNPGNRISIIVNPECRGQGVAEEAIRELISSTPDRYFEAGVHRKNVPCLISFLKCGFEICGFDGQNIKLECMRE